MKNFQEEILCRDDVVDILEAAHKGESCLCSSSWLIKLSNKINSTLNYLDQLKKEVYVDRPQIKEPTTTATRNKANIWLAQVMYKHRGFSTSRFEELGEIIHSDLKEDALQVAKWRAEEWINKTFKEKEIEYWEVKVRPLIN